MDSAQDDRSGGPAFVVPTACDRWRLVDVAWRHLGVVTRRAVGPLITSGGITVDGAAAAIAQPVLAGQQLRLSPAVLPGLARDRQLVPPAPGPLDVVHEDADLLVVDKPSGLHVHPMGPHRDDTVLGRALWRAGGRPDQPWTDHVPHPAHRLDRPTSGLLILAKGHRVRATLQQQLERRAVRRTYTATVEGVVDADEGVIDVPLGPDARNPRRRGALALADGGRAARSRYRVLSRTATTTRLELHLETGRTHQLRAHLAHLGHPIVGDVEYGAAPTEDPRWVTDLRLPAIALRATALALAHPVTGQPLDLRAPGPR